MILPVIPQFYMQIHKAIKEVFPSPNFRVRRWVAAVTANGEAAVLAQHSPFFSMSSEYSRANMDMGSSAWEGLKVKKMEFI